MAHRYGTPKEVDYVGPPADPPPTGPSPSEPIEYHLDSAILPLRSDGRASDECEEAQLADTLLQEDLTGSFRAMRSTTPGSEERRLLPPPCSPELGVYEEAQRLCRTASPWQRALGLAACSQPPDVADDQPEKAPLRCRLLACLWTVALLLLLVVSLGLQWAHCRRVYLRRLITYSELEANISVPAETDYLCRSSFVWTFLVPRLLWCLGYMSVFVCWFCLGHPDLIQIIAKAYEAVTDQREYFDVSHAFMKFCRRDRGLIVFWCGAINIFSLFSSLMGEGILTYDLTILKPSPRTSLTLATYVVTCLVRLLVDNVMAYCIVIHILSLKYVHLMVVKTGEHLMVMCLAQSFPTCFNYAQLQTIRIGQLVQRSQPCISAAVLLAMLRICQSVTLVWLDLSSQPRCWQSVGQLPVAVCFAVLVLYLIRRSIMLSEDGQHLRAKTPRAVLHDEAGSLASLRADADGSEPEPAPGEATEAAGPAAAAAGPAAQPAGSSEPGAGPSSAGDGSSAVGAGSSAAGARPSAAREEGRGWDQRNTTLWQVAMKETQTVTGQLFGLDAHHLMYWVAVCFGALYCICYRALELYWPLV